MLMSRAGKDMRNWQVDHSSLFFILREAVLGIDPFMDSSITDLPCDLTISVLDMYPREIKKSAKAVNESSEKHGVY